MVCVIAGVAFALALPFVCQLAVAQFEPSLVDADDGGVRLWINALLVGAFVTALWTLTGRALLSGWLGYWSLWCLHALNEAKLGEMQRMLGPADLLLIGQVVSNLGLFWHYVAVDWLVASAAACILVVTAVLARFEPRVLPRLRWRMPLIAASVALIASLLAGHAFWRQQLDDARLGGFEIWAPDHSIARAGLVAGLVRMGWQRDTDAPPLASSARARLDAFLADNAAALQALAAVPSPAQLPDIIVVQSEALFDPGRLRGLRSEDWLHAFRAMQQRGIHGDLRVPAFGGGTIRTEFEVLTGYPLAAFPQVVYPYYGLTDRPLDSLPRQLNALGYRSFAVHPYERSFWNRDAALRNLGIAEAHFDGETVFRDPRRRGPYVTDGEAYRGTLQLLAQDTRPQFAFVITMENHSPWRHRSNIDKMLRDAIPVPAGLDPEARKALQTYLLHLQHGDRALDAFAETLLGRERPTILLVYSDHMPALRRVYDQLGFDDGRSASEQPVPYAILGNFPLPAGRRDLSADALPSLLLQLAGLPLRNHLARAQLIREAAPHCPREEACDPLLHFAARNDLAH